MPPRLHDNWILAAYDGDATGKSLAQGFAIPLEMKSELGFKKEFCEGRLHAKNVISRRWNLKETIHVRIVDQVYNVQIYKIIQK